MIKILIADDQKILKESLKHIIQQDPDLDVVAFASNGKEAFFMCQNHLPDVVLMDIKMPECNGIEGTMLIKESFPDIKVLIISSYDYDEYIEKSLKSGADGYILKDIDPIQLSLAIKSVYNGMSVIHNSVLSFISRSIYKLPPNEIREKNFSPKEIQILRMIVDGKSNTQIAQYLNLSKGRIANILTSLFNKTGVIDRTQLAVFAVKYSLI